MKISLKWLKDFVNVNAEPSVIATRLTNAGFEVEEIAHQDEFLKHVVVGKIEKIEKHPNADTLFVCHVNIGNRNVQIITSAKNVFEGALVPVSLDGAVLANGVVIKDSMLRGVKSEGMFCSGEELGIDDNFYEGASVNGILILKEQYACGLPIADALELNDIIFDINITANRPDAMSILGIAREISALFSLPIHMPENKAKKATVSSNKSISVSVENKTLCPRYMAVVAQNICIGKSPLWLKARLLGCGIKPVNNIVDITNYVLIEYGQPMHAFDYEQIKGNKIVVRNALKNEKLFGLDKKEHVLTQDMLVIANNEKAMVVAGVIGGVESGICETTNTIVFESAVFDRKNIRITSRNIGVRTDSSSRFEKGVDIGSAKIGLERALSLLAEFNAGEVVGEVVDAMSGNDNAKEVIGSIAKIQKILGILVEKQKLIQIMESLGVKTHINGDQVVCQVPAFRFDIENSADIAEEFIRLYGYEVYDSLNPTIFQNATPTKGAFNPMHELQNRIRNIFYANGFYETYNYTICDKKLPEKLLFNKNAPESRVIEILNPISEDIGSIRTTMVGSALLCVKLNQSRGNASLNIFECGKTYIPESLPLTNLPVEAERLSFTASATKENFFSFKGLVQKVLAWFEIETELQAGNQVFLHPGISAQYVNKENGKVVAYWGKVHPTVAKNYDINSETFYGEFDLDALIALPTKTYEVKSLSRFPTVERDLAFVVDESVNVQTLLSSIKNSAGPNFASCELFDIYRSKALGENKKSLAFKIKFLSMTKTLVDEEVDAPMRKILKDAEYKFNAYIRR